MRASGAPPIGPPPGALRRAPGPHPLLRERILSARFARTRSQSLKFAPIKKYPGAAPALALFSPLEKEDG